MEELTLIARKDVIALMGFKSLHGFNNFLKKHPDTQEVHCSIACRIGSPEIIVSLYDGHLNELTSYRETVDPAAIIDRFFLRKPRFAQLCRNGLLS